MLAEGREEEGKSIFTVFGISADTIAVERVATVVGVGAGGASEWMQTSAGASIANKNV